MQETFTMDSIHVNANGVTNLPFLVYRNVMNIISFIVNKLLLCGIYCSRWGTPRCSPRLDVYTCTQSIAIIIVHYSILVTDPQHKYQCCCTAADPY